MNTLLSWLADAHRGRRVLDLGCGDGSFDYGHFGCENVIGVDAIAANLCGAGTMLPICADASALPFPARCFDLIICHHSLEHFRDAHAVMREIGRVARPSARLFISVPEAASLSDRLYRLMLAGGGHFQRFTFRNVVDLVQSEAHLRLTCWQNLYTSFNYVDKLNFVPAPAGRLPGPLPRRMRYLGQFPSAAFSLARFFLNVFVRLADRWFSSGLSRGGWALAFDESGSGPEQEPGMYNVCMNCGCGFQVVELAPVGGFFYRCPRCRVLNPLFRKAPPNV
jgi:SAM-dependent methyltransferase